MRKMYKDGKVCTADTEQVTIMEDAGWSCDEPKAEKSENSSDASEGKTITKKKTLKKKKKSSEDN